MRKQKANQQQKIQCNTTFLLYVHTTVGCRCNKWAVCTANMQGGLLVLVFCFLLSEEANWMKKDSQNNNQSA